MWKRAGQHGADGGRHTPRSSEDVNADCANDTSTLARDAQTMDDIRCASADRPIPAEPSIHTLGVWGILVATLTAIFSAFIARLVAEYAYHRTRLFARFAAALTLVVLLTAGPRVH